MKIITTIKGDTITNVKGTGEEKAPNGGSWRDYGSVRAQCAAQSCGEKATDGAHVTHNGGKTIYIAPMCHSCNMKHGETFGVNAGVTLIETP